MELENQVNENVNETNQYQEYIDTINELKQNSVSKEKYAQLQEEKQALIDALKSGQQIEIPEDKPIVDVDALRGELFNMDNSMTNLEYCSKVLELRDALLEQGQQDPFLPNGKDYQYDPKDEEKAERVAQVMQECIEYADGDSQLFTQELMRRTKDDSTMLKNKPNNKVQRR